MPRPIDLRYGKGRITLQLPDSADVLIGPETPALPDPEAAVREALRSPIGSAPLRDIAEQRRPKSVVITISDITRPVPNELIVGEILAELNAAGVPDAAVTVLIATGMHRPSTPEERDIMLGQALQQRVAVVDHEAKDVASTTRVSDDPPVGVNSLYVEADLKIVTGLLEPHFMAGFSGGRKGVCPGIVDLDTVQRFHGVGVMGDPNSVEGRLDGNPCHEESMRVCGIVGIDFLVNVAITDEREPAGVYAGDWKQAFFAGCDDVANWTSATLDEPYDLVVTSAGGFPLDKNFYQTVKGMCTAMPALHDGSTLLMFSACEEIGEPEYVALFDKFGADWRAFLDHIETSGRTDKDQWEYQMQTRVLQRIGAERLILANDGLDFATQSRIATTPCPGSPQEDAATRGQRFIDDYAAAHPQARIAVIPEGPYTMLRAMVPAAV
ncbi:MAG: nickel-dependent lactate racemase [Planctomycetota bacterium]